MSAYAILRIEKIKSVSHGNARLKHSRREIECPTAVSGKCNKHLVFTDRAEEMRKDKKTPFKTIFHERIKGQKVRRNAVHAIEVVLTFSPNAVNNERLRSWASANMQWLADNFGGAKNVIDARLHLDEATPHIHAFIIPLDERGKLNARAFLGGTNNRMSELQTSYAKAMEPFRLERGISKKITKAQHQNSQRWHAEQDHKELRLQTYEKVFGTEPEWDFERYSEFKTTQADLDTERDYTAASKLPQKPSKTLQNAPSSSVTPRDDNKHSKKESVPERKNKPSGTDTNDADDTR